MKSGGNFKESKILSLSMDALKTSLLKKLPTYLLFSLLSGRKLTHQLDCFLCCIFTTKGNESITSVLTRKRIHHETQIPNWTSFLKEWYQFIFIKVSGNFTNKNLKRKRTLETKLFQKYKVLFHTWKFLGKEVQCR